MGLTFEGQLNSSDLKYYQNLRENKEFKVDQSKLQEYFPLHAVLDGTFKIYQLLLGLEFKKIQNPSSYHEELKLVFTEVLLDILYYLLNYLKQ